MHDMGANLGATHRKPNLLAIHEWRDRSQGLWAVPSGVDAIEWRKKLLEQHMGQYCCIKSVHV